MSESKAVEKIRKELKDVLEETFENVHGIYIDRRTSLFETLDTVTAEQASKPLSDNCPSIAAHVEHVRFYLQVIIEGCFQKQPTKKIDWDESWKLNTVTAYEWTNLKNRLRAIRDDILTEIDNLQGWEGEDDIGASLAIVAHTAYHLGAIRHTLCTII